MAAFTQYAEAFEQSLEILYRHFDEACASAREAAAHLTKSNPLQSEMLLAMRVSEETLGNVATAKNILGARFGPTLDRFFQGLDAANAHARDPTGEGNIYRPS